MTYSFGDKVHTPAINQIESQYNPLGSTSYLEPVWEYYNSKNRTELRLKMNLKMIKTYFVILLILLSGTVYFGLIYRQNMIILLTASCILFLTKRKQIVSKKNLLIFFIISIIFLVNALINISSMNFILFNNYLAYILIVFSLAVIVSNISIYEFRKNYIIIMLVIGFVSLICFFISQKMPQYASNFYKIVTTKSGNIFIASPYFTWGWNYIFQRNAGMFWEPGAFQGYLNLAILFLNDDINSVKKYVLILFFSIIILTTGSTTGYILLPIILLSVFIKNFKYIRKHRIKIMAFFIMSTMLLIVYIFNTNNIDNKFNSDNGSYLKRSKDTSLTYKVMFDRPFTGYGLSTEAGDKQVMFYNGTGGNSSGLIVIGYSFGIPVLLLYLVRGYFGLRNTFRNVNTLILMSVFVILFMTESISLFPIYMVFLFEWKKPVNKLEVVNGKLKG